MADIFRIIFLASEMMINEIKDERTSLPFFSVIITTYNRADLLKRALDSLIAQTEADWEGIIIDDGSTDNTAFEVIPYLKCGSKFSYIKQKNKGYANAKNTGIFLSKGKFITFLDSDDEYNPKHLEMRKSILKENKVTEFLHGGVKVKGSQLVPDRFNYNRMIHLSDCVIGGTFFIKRDLAISFNGFSDIPLGSDGDFFDRINKAEVNILKTEIPTYIYHRETENSITNNFENERNSQKFHNNRIFVKENLNEGEFK